MADSLVAYEVETFDAADVACLYQPIIRLRDSRPIAAEVLARRRGQTGKLLGPETFKSALYEGESARRLTNFVVQAIIHDIIAGHLRAVPLIYAINLPLDVLMQPDLLQRIDYFRAQAGIDPPKVSFELTETKPIRDFERAAAVIRSLRQRGYRVALDDVSPAMEALDSLFKLPFSTVKLDRSVTRMFSHDPSVETFVVDIVRRAKKLHCNLIAEGIEDSLVLDTLFALGVGYAQGFVLARPMPGVDLQCWFTDWQSDPPKIQSYPQIAATF